MRKITGSIDTTTTGRHRVRVPDGGERPTVGVFDTWEEANAMRAAVVKVITAGDDAGETLESYGEKVLTDRDVNKRVRDPGSDWGRWRKHVKGTALARTPLRRVKRQQVEEWYEALVERVAESTAKNSLNVLRVIFRAAKRIVRDNPCKGLELAKPTRANTKSQAARAWTYATPSEQERFLAAAAPYPAARALIAIAIATGLRAGELVSMRLEDIHTDAARPHLLVRYGGAPDLPTKSGEPRRVPLTPIAVDAIDAWLALLPTVCKKNPLALAFPGARGGFRSENHVIRWDVWKKILKTAQIKRRFRWHDLRHTCASSLVSGWWGRRWALIEVKDFLGHSTIEVTERYAHLAESALDDAAAATGTGHNRPRPPNSSTITEHARRFPKPGVGSSSLPGRATEKQARIASATERSVADSWPIAETLRERIAAGDAAGAGDAARELATSVLGRRDVVLALDVLAGGPHMLDRALDLVAALDELGVDLRRAGGGR